MTKQVMTYYIPDNPSIPKGHIYTFYLNHNTNLDLTPILNTQTITVNNVVPSPQGPIAESNQIMISKEDYTRLLELNNIAYQLTTKRTNAIQAFIDAETKTTSELTKINTERQELIKKLIRLPGERTKSNE